MAYPWSYSPRLFYDEILHDPRSDRYCRSRTHIVPQHSQSIKDRPSQPFARQSPPFHREQVQTLESTNSLVPSNAMPAINRNQRIDSTPRAIPAISFKAAIDKLKVTNATALDFFSEFHNRFKEETKPLDYATRKLLDEIWEAKVRKFETKCRVKPNRYQSQYEVQEEVSAITFSDQSFLELRDELLRRCTMMQNTRVPHWPVASPSDQERKNSAEAFV